MACPRERESKRSLARTAGLVKRRGTPRRPIVTLSRSLVLVLRKVSAPSDPVGRPQPTDDGSNQPHEIPEHHR
jgi:hypothetical protein